VVVAQRPLVTNEEARFAVTHTLVHLRQRERNPPHATEFTSAHDATRSVLVDDLRSSDGGVLYGRQPTCIVSYTLTEPPLLSPGHPLARTTAS
jgi:hypothetical protein